MDLQGWHLLPLQKIQVRFPAPTHLYVSLLTIVGNSRPWDSMFSSGICEHQACTCWTYIPTGKTIEHSKCFFKVVR